MSNIEEIPFTAQYTDKTTNKEVSLSAILTKSSSTSDTILLCHGMFGSKNSSLNLHLLSGLKNFWSVLRFDFEGNGDSSGEWSYADYEREVRNISDIIEYSQDKYGIKIVAIIGHSKAGADVFISASRPNLIKNEKCCFVSLGGRLTFGKPEKRFMNPKNEVKNISEQRKKLILQVHGREDTSTPVEEAYVVEKEIPGAEVIWIEKANHFFKGVENDMVNAVVDWLKKKLNN